MGISTAQIEDAVTSHTHQLNGLVWFRELRIGTGYGAGRERLIDLWGIWTTPSNAKRTVAIEIKRTKSDYYRETNNPQKRRGALLHSNQYYFAAPYGIVDPKTLPPECGLIEIRDDGTNGLYGHVRVDAPFEERFPPSWTFVMSICRQFSRGLV